jgi:hypothetical protein
MYYFVIAFFDHFSLCKQHMMCVIITHDIRHDYRIS